MDSTPSSPTSRRRRSSQFDTAGRFSSRRSSQYSQKRSSQGPLDFASPRGAGNGLDSLADELANAWDEDAADEPSELDKSNLEESALDQSLVQDESLIDSNVDNDRTSTDAATSPDVKRNPKRDSKLKPAPRHSRTASHYDGSEYGDMLEYEISDDVPASLKASMADIEGLAKQGSAFDGAGQEDAFTRMLEELRDLGGQAGIESGASRLITAHTALSMHLAHQTRNIQTLTYALLSPLAPPPDEQQIEELLPLIADSISSIPQPMLGALTSLVQLSSTSKDVIDTLSNLSDSLHMSRQITQAASRRLKSARELVAEIRRESAKCDEGVRWVEEGRWQRRLADRECASVCEDVVGGFEEVCQGWRDKLVASAEVSAA